MGGATMLVELVLVVLLGATLLHAVRLSRAIAVLRAEGGGLAAATAGFESGTRQAEAGLERLREAAQAVAGQLSEAVAQGAALKDDLVFLAERGGLVADRLDGAVRAGRALDKAGVGGDVPGLGGPSAAAGDTGGVAVRSQAERDLVLALRRAR